MYAENICLSLIGQKNVEFISGFKLWSRLPELHVSSVSPLGNHDIFHVNDSLKWLLLKPSIHPQNGDARTQDQAPHMQLSEKCNTTRTKKEKKNSSLCHHSDTTNCMFLKQKNQTFGQKILFNLETTAALFSRKPPACIA